MIKKLISFCMVAMLVFSALPVGAIEAYASDTSKESISNDIEIIKPYVEVTKEGTIRFKELPKGFYDKYSLEELQKHFDYLNTLSEAGDITINNDLSIQKNSISTMAVYGKWTYHWWGYDRKFTNSQADDYVDDLVTAAAGATIVAGLGSAFPPVSGIATVQAGYWALLAVRVDANNEGNGVYVAVTWALIFDVEPL